MEGGLALADVLFGAVEPGGRLPFAMPTDEAHLPPFDRNATSVTYDRWHGQRRLDRDETPAAYPLGFGLSYSSFTIDDVEVETHDASGLVVRAVVHNTGYRAGGHVVQVYVTRPQLGDRFLVGFRRVHLEPGEQVAVTIDVPAERLATRQAPGRWEITPGTYRIDVGSHAADEDASSSTVQLP